MAVTKLQDMPEELVQALRRAAALNQRTLEEEIVQRLLRSLQGEAAGAEELDGVNPEFAQQVEEFIQEYRPALDALAK